MYLYEETDDKLKIWELTEDAEKLRQYRIEELGGKDYPNAKLYQLQSSDCEMIELFQRSINGLCRKDVLTAPTYTFFGSHPKSEFAPCQSSDSDIQKIYLIENYLNANSHNLGFVRYARRDNSFEYYLPTKNRLDIESKLFGSIYTLNGILRLPHSIYLLELFRSGNYAACDIVSMKGQFKAFNLSEKPIKEFDLTILDEFRNNGIAELTEEYTLKESLDSKILQKVREVNKIESTEDE